ncbi:LutC/YkgG family protein [Thiorhodovibrio frisius]|uniref:LUD domain-containing protein n=1 Tax=Thiorhodovibrio frisius TaxID=631362 RepID=H8Z070_9GAMM|nr:lactate utilization protein [Thiorhodovibrio frisius]EIC22278.1 hypothetical protein Thi970DRAFT_02531 [Thiorhodovibrio frisius]WPL24573.1 Lactate utilization protein C [Thiorhodovibrio frisius]
MTEAREQILGRLVAAPAGQKSKSTSSSDSKEISEESSALTPGKENTQNDLETFCRALTAVHGEVHRVGADWPAQIAATLASAGVEHLWYGADGPLGAELRSGWPARDTGNGPGGPIPKLRPFADPIESCRQALFAEHGAGFTSALGAIAETGTLILWPGPSEPRTLSLVPEVHCVLLERSCIAPTLEDWMTAFCQQPDHAPLPTNLLLVTGPSKSADIEQTLTLGVHGPKRLVVFVLDS